MKIDSLIKRLQAIQKSQGNVEVFLSDSYISANHMSGEIKDFSFYDHWYEVGRKEKKGILLGAEDPDDSMPPSSNELEREDEEDEN